MNKTILILLLLFIPPQLFCEQIRIKLSFENNWIYRSVESSETDILKIAITEILKGPSQKEIKEYLLEEHYYQSNSELIDYLRYKGKNLIIINIPSTYSDIGGLSAEEQVYLNLRNTIKNYLTNTEVAIILVDDEKREYWGQEGLGVSVILYSDQ